MNNIWEILGIAPTDSKKEIRKAYAAKSREIHPEEKPEEFQQLKDAYEKARKWIAQETANQNQEVFFQESSDREDFMAEDATKTDSNEEDAAAGEPQESLLEKLDELEECMEEREVHDLKAYGIFEQIESLFLDAKKRGNKMEWRQFFLTEEFLEVQYDSGFTSCFKQYLMEQTYVDYQELPQLFLIELMNAYGLSTGLLTAYERVSGEVAAAMFDDAQRNIAKIWSAQKLEWKEQRGYRILDKKENIVRNKAFADYGKLLKYDKIGSLKKEREEVWGNEILSCGTWENILEDKCKDSDYAGDCKRNICFLRLLTYFLQHHKVREEVCIYIYQTYHFDKMQGRYYEKFYTPIQEEILKQYPDLEQRMLEKVPEKDYFKEWKRHLFSFGKDIYESYFAIPANSAAVHTYHTQEVEVPQKLRDELDALLENPFFEEHMYEDSFLEEVKRYCILQQIPSFIVDRFYAEYMREDRKEKRSIPMVKGLLEGIVVRKSFWKLYQETNCYREYVYDLSQDSSEFWVYYLLHAYGNRHATIPYEEQDNFYYEKYCTRETERYLQEYMVNYYRPSREWCIRFTGMDKETGEIPAPRREVIALRDGRNLTIEYQVNQILFNGATLTWEQLKEETDTRRFLLLLAVTRIEEAEREEAKDRIARHLMQIPIQEATIPFLSDCLSKDNGRSDSHPEKWYPYIVEKKGSVKDRVDVTEQTDLEKAETCLKLLTRNQREDAFTKLEGFLEHAELPEYVKEAYRKCWGLLSNHVVFHWGNQDRDMLYQMCVTGLFGIGQSLQNYYDLTNFYLEDMAKHVDEESYPLGWIWPQYRAPILILVGESGSFYVKHGLVSTKRIENLEELIAEVIPFMDVTELFHYEKEVILERYRPGDGCVYGYR